MKPRLARILAPAFALILLLTAPALSSCRQADPADPASSAPPAQSDHGQPGHDRTVRTSGSTPYGLRYEGTASCAELSAVELNGSSEECLRLFAQYMTSIVTCDFSLHIPLFQQEVLERSLYPEMKRAGYTTEQAVARISENAAELIGVYLFEVEYEVVGLTVNDPAEREKLLGSLPEEADPSAVGDVLTYRIADMRLLINGILSVPIDAYNIEDNGVCFYRYQDEWYLTPSLLDDDFSIDLLQADASSDEYYYHTELRAGTVAAVENRIVFLEEYPEECFLLPPDAVPPAVGDAVELSYYDQCSGLAGEHCTKGTPLKMYKIPSDN